MTISVKDKLKDSPLNKGHLNGVKIIPAKDKLILALDTPDFTSAKTIVENLGDEVNFYKIGLEMMMSGSYFEMIKFLKSKNKKIFADLKLYDIPETVGRAVRNLAQYEVDFLTIHTANHDMMARAAQNKGKMQIIAVTVLTSLAQNDLNEMGFNAQISVEELVLKKAAAALKAGLDGVVASALEAKKLRQELGENFLIVTPGIRLESAKDNNDDQKRTTGVAEALSYGATHLVVGRPITQSENQRATAQKINEMILKSAK